MHNHELYFLNNLYDDTIINDFIGTFRNRLYKDVLDSKKFIQQNKLMTGKLSSFEIDHDFNDKYGFPYESYSLTFSTEIIPYYSEKAFIDKYGYNKPITSIEIMKDTSVFNKAIYLYIGDYFIYDVTVMFDRHSCTIVIPDNSEFSSSIIDDILASDTEDKSWSLMWASKSDYYYGYLTRLNLFDGNRIYVSKLPDRKIFNKKKSNNWTIYLTINAAYPNKMAMAPTVYIQDEVNGDYFLVSDEFVEYAKNLSINMKCFIVNNPECYGSGIYINTSTTTPIFQIPYIKNPIPIENFTVWKYDHVTNRKLHPLETDIIMTYPNIYDFSNMISDTDAYIEWLESVNDITSFDTYLQNYIDCYEDEYTAMITNGTADQRILDYKPIDEINFTSENYFMSEYYGDNRAWRLDKLITILKDNPMRYKELLETVYSKNREFITASYTYDEDQHIYERSIMDNRTHCNNAIEVLKLFDEPHTYIKVYNSSCKHRNCILYINGERKQITYNMTFGSDMYIYFPVSYIENHEDIQIDINLEDSAIVDQTFNLDFVGGHYSFDNADELNKDALADLVYYVDGTRLFIDPKDISYRLRLELHEVKYIGTDSKDEFVSLPSEVLHTNQSEIVKPIDSSFVVLRNKREIIDVPGSIYHKKIDLNDVEVTITNPSYEDVLIHVATVSFSFIKTFSITEDQAGDTLEIPNFKGKRSRSRFHLFHDGKLVNPSMYEMEFDDIYDGTARIINPAFSEGDLIVEYIGYDEVMVYNGRVGDLKKTDGCDIMYLDGILPLPINAEFCKIYIDGYRIHNNQIHTIGQNDMITITDNIHGFTDTSTISIYVQEMDPDPYEYSLSNRFLPKIAEEDERFRNYLLDTFGI